MKMRIISLLLFLLVLSQGFAQEKKAGPVITEFGKVWPINNPDRCSRRLGGWPNARERLDRERK